MSKLDDAMKLVEAGMNPHAAARQAGLKQASSVYAEIKRRKLPVCPECGSQVEAGKLSDLALKVDRVLQQLDYTAEHSEGIERRETCRAIATLLRG